MSRHAPSGPGIGVEWAALGLGTVVGGAFDDAAVKAALEIEGDEEPLCLLPLGVRVWPPNLDD